MGKSIDNIRDSIYQALDAHDYDQAYNAIKTLRVLNPGEAWGLETAIAIEKGNLEEAKAAWQKLAQLLPQDIYTQFLRARIHHLGHEYVTALHILEHLITEEIPLPYQEKIYNLLGQCYRFLGEGEKSADAYLQAAKSALSIDMARMEYSNYLFNLHYQNLLLASEKEAAIGYAKLFAEIKTFPEKKRTLHQDILRIGYISPDFRNHVLLNFIYALITHRDKNRYKVYIYAANIEDAYSRKLAANTDVWRNVYGMPFQEIAQIIYHDEIDILVDLAGHGKGCILPVFAYRPAPVQVSGIGYFASTGLPGMDYFLSDVYLAEKNAEFAFTEKLCLLPHSHLCYTPKKNISPGEVPPMLRNGYITFGSFNNFTKINQAVLKLWRKILFRVPQARMIIKADVFSYVESAAYARNKLQAAGLPLERIECRPVTAEYLQEYRDVDIVLDTFPYPGGGTGCDALYMGVPVVSLAGESHGSRFGYSLLANLGLEELCAHDEASYINIAIALANDKELLINLHKTLRHRMEQSPLMQGGDYTCAVERTYEKIWHEYLWKMQKTSREELEAGAIEALDRGQAGRAEEIIDYLTIAYGENSFADFLRANLYQKQHQGEKALIYVNKALQSGKLLPGQMGAAYHLLGILHKQAGRRDKAAEAYWNSAQYKDLSSGKNVDYSNYLLNLAYFSTDRQKNYQAALGYGEILKEIKPLPKAPHYHHDKLRLGYLSADFNRHVMACFMQVFFKDYDTNLYEVYGYHLGECDDITTIFAEQASVWREIGGMGAADAASLIRSDEIDILVDFGGHTAYSGLPILAYKPAPVQISGIGYFATTGLCAVDYFLADEYTADSEEEQYFTENILRLPHSHLCWQPLPQMPNYISPLPGRRKGYITYGCFNNWDKVTEDMLRLWGRILTAMPKAKLYLKAGVFKEEKRRRQAQEQLAAGGIDLGRVILAGPSDDYLNAYQEIDIALDTYPYPGGGTTCDALYMGVPVITLKGNTHHSRFGYSLLCNGRLADLCVASSYEEYVKLAVELGQDEVRLIDLRQNIRRYLQQTPVMNGKLYMRDWEDACEKILASKYAGKMDSDIIGKVEKLYAENDWPALIRTAVRSYYQADITQKAVLGQFLAFAYYKQNNHVKTCAWAQEVLNLTGKDTQMTYLLASATDQLGWLSKSLDLAENALQEKSLPQDLYRLYCHLASVVAYKLGHPRMTELYWRSYEVDHDVNMYSSYLLTYNCREVDEKELLQKSLAYGKLFRDVIPYSHNKRKMKQHDKMRIGYISPDYRFHVMYKFYQVLLGGHDSEHYKVYAYSLTKKKDNYTDLCQQMADCWRDVADLSPKEAAACIYEDEIDILVDLAGHTAGGSLPVMAYKPAPVQISGLGYMATTGLTTIDYFLTDKYVDPVGKHDELFSEKLIRLTSQFCYTPEQGNIMASTGAPCWDRGWLLFGVFNAYRKFTEEMLALWQEILEKTSNSKLLIKCQVFFAPAMVEEAYNRFKKAGFDMERVIFEPATRDYMERYLDVDIALDTYPYPGGGTTCDALYMGVPVISLYKDRHSSRFSYSILSNIGLAELAADSPAEYVKRAVALAHDQELLNILHQNLRSMMVRSPLMDREHYMKELETHYDIIAEAFGLRGMYNE